MPTNTIINIPIRNEISAIDSSFTLLVLLIEIYDRKPAEINKNASKARRYSA
jgi:hypothetical protein